MSQSEDYPLDDVSPHVKAFLNRQFPVAVAEENRQRISDVITRAVRNRCPQTEATAIS